MDQRNPFVGAGAIAFVEHQQCVFLLDIKFLEDFINRGDLLEDRWVARVGHVHEQIGLPSLFERRSETCDQVVR